jgi:hypothetical protein
MRRVLRPGGSAVLIDVLGCEDALVDTHLQAMELLRDPSHARNRSAAEWRRLATAAGFAIVEEAVFEVRLEFAAWIGRMRTPPDSVAAIRRLQAGAPRQVAEALRLEDDGSFAVQTGVFVARG